MTLAIHPIDDLRAARADLLGALQGCTPIDLLVYDDENAWCGRDTLLHMTACLHDLAALIVDLAVYGCQRGPNAAGGREVRGMGRVGPGVEDGQRSVRPECAVASLVTAHARLLSLAEGLDERQLWRRGLTRAGTEISGWELLLAEAAHEREHAARLGSRSPWSKAVCRGPVPLLHAS